LLLGKNGAGNVYFDDIRIHPFNADMKSYVYDPRTLRLMAELDENNYTTYYDYDEEGQLVRVKKETVQGIKTIKETRTAKQKTVTNIQ
jgi:YD repeat-containing protein